MDDKNMRRIILTIVNLDYLNVLKSWLMSMRMHGNGYLVRVDFVNGNQDIYDRLKKVYPNIEIIHHDIPKVENFDQNLMNLIHIRPPQMWKVLNEDWDQVLSLDCDTLIRGSMERIWDNVTPGVLKVADRGAQKPDDIRFKSAVYLLGNSKEIRDYYRDSMDEIGDKFEFMEINRVLCSMWKKHINKIKFVPLSERFSDGHMEKKSIIWHVKHKRLLGKKDSDGKRRFVKYGSTCLAEANKYYGDE